MREQMREDERRENKMTGSERQEIFLNGNKMCGDRMLGD